MSTERGENRSYLVVDEGYSVISETSFIDISVYDKNGEMVFYTDFERNITPHEIAENLEFVADQIVEGYSNDYKELELANILRHEARKILNKLS